MRILSPDPIIEKNNGHAGQYILAFVIGICILLVFFVGIKILSVGLSFAIKHYYYVLGLIGLFLLYKIMRKRKIANIRMKEQIKREYR